jgi:hypothetical protein
VTVEQACECGPPGMFGFLIQGRDEARDVASKTLTNLLNYDVRVFDDIVQDTRSDDPVGDDDGAIRAGACNDTACRRKRQVHDEIIVTKRRSKLERLSSIPQLAQRWGTIVGFPLKRLGIDRITRLATVVAG